MGRHPFGEFAEAYMSSVRGVYSEETWKNRARRYKRIEQRLIQLQKERKVSTVSPKGMDPEDVKAYILFARESLSTADMVHEVNALKQLFAYCGNPAVELCLSRYPGLRPSFRGTRRKPAMSDSMYGMILERSRTVDPADFALVRAYALVLLYIATGCRNKELRLAELRDLDPVGWTLEIVHVKGEGSYGLPRRVPVPPEVRGIVSDWLLVRRRWLADNGCASKALFPSKDSADGFLSGNSIRAIKHVVEEDLGIEFDLRMCRRTFGQRYLDAGLDIESTSVLMGHASTKTTEAFYSRRRVDSAVEKAMDTWGGDGGQ